MTSVVPRNSIARPTNKIIKTHDTTLPNRVKCFSVSRSKPQTDPIKVVALERHDLSAQTFAPIVVGRWLAAVAPTAPDGGPDFERLEAFVLDETVGICYRPNIWHHPFACFDGPAEMLMLRWDDRTEADTTWAKVPAGLDIEIALPK